MAFSYEWHSDTFSYKEKGGATAPPSVLQKKRKKKHLSNGENDAVNSTDAIESASKKLKFCSEDASLSENQPKLTVESLLEGVISATQVKPALKTTKKIKKLSVSFADDVKSKVEKKSEKSSNMGSVTKNSTSTEGSKKKKKQKKREDNNKNKSGIVPAKPSSNVKTDETVVRSPSSVSNDCGIALPEPVTVVSSEVRKKKKKKEKLTTEDADAKRREFNDSNSVSNSSPTKKKKNADVVANSSNRNSSLSIDKAENVKDVIAKKKTVKPQEDENEWEDLDSDGNWNSMNDCNQDDDDDEEEVLDYTNDKEPELDENFHSDLKSLLAELNFDSLKKQMSSEGHDHSNLEEKTKSTESKKILGKNSEKEPANETKKANHDICESKSTTKVNSEENPSVKNNLMGSNTAIAQKLGSSLAKFSKPDGGEHQYRTPLARQMAEKLSVAKFRMINEQLYKTTGQEAQALFRDDPESFHVYHEGFKSQVARWPLKPLDIIVDWLKAQDSSWTVADFGCGEGELADRVKQKVHSLDLVALKPHITVCDMAHTPLKSQSINVAVFCLSLMGTNVSDFIREANRTLKSGGVMKIAEVESRITNIEEFVANVQKFGFKCWKKPVNHNYFITFDFKKVKDIKNRPNLPDIKLKPCLYKKR